MTRYQHLATLLAERIEQGLYRHGEKLPSVRSLSQEHGVSISTVQQAYQTLETMKLITRSRVQVILSHNVKPSRQYRHDASGAAPGGNNPVGSGAGHAGGA